MKRSETKPRFRWFAVYRDQRYPRQDSMPDKHWGWDAVCQDCGWDSHTGGAIRASVRRDIERHILLDHSA